MVARLHYTSNLMVARFSSVVHRLWVTNYQVVVRPYFADRLMVVRPRLMDKAIVDRLCLMVVRHHVIMARLLCTNWKVVYWLFYAYSEMVVRLYSAAGIVVVGFYFTTWAMVARLRFSNRLDVARFRIIVVSFCIMGASEYIMVAKLYL